MKLLLPLIIFTLLSTNTFGVEIVTKGDFVVDVNKEYNWQVTRGDLKFWIDGKQLMFVVDPKGAKSCYLTIQDALDMYSILQQFGQYLFDSSDSFTKYETRITQESEYSFSWDIAGEELSIFLNNESEFLQVKYESIKPIPFDVGLISEVAQAIGLIIKNAAS